MLSHDNSSAVAPAGVVRDRTGPSFEDLRPGKPTHTDTFPVYPDLADLLVAPDPDPRLGPAPHVLATCAGYAYSDIDTVAMMMTRLGLERAHCRQITRSVDAMLINSTAHLVQSHDGRVAVLCYRGTPPLDLVSWFLDADVYPERIRVSGAEESAFDVHAGFYRNVRITRHEVVRSLEHALEGRSVTGEHETLRPLEALYITGHSLGGAMAALMAPMLLMSQSPLYRRIAATLKGVHTYGAPMVGSPEFAEAAQEALDRAGVPLLRFSYRDDPVPRLPPKDVGAYAHFGAEYHFDDGWPLEPSRSSGQLHTVLGLASSFLPFGLAKFVPLRGLRWPQNIEHHLPHHYVSSMVPPGRPDEFGDFVCS